ncbi:hypothetical protein CMI37_17800 [Candidatus Pacearchaeota archaeon]|nr:hypothetical protein [Candidatus Pacearchaeota archaeon]
MEVAQPTRARLEGKSIQAPSRGQIETGGDGSSKYLHPAFGCHRLHPLSCKLFKGAQQTLEPWGRREGDLHPAPREDLVPPGPALILRPGDSAVALALLARDVGFHQPDSLPRAASCSRAPRPGRKLGGGG